MKEEIMALLEEGNREDIYLFKPYSYMEQVQWLMRYIEEYDSLPHISLYKKEFYPEEENFRSVTSWDYFKKTLTEKLTLYNIEPLLTDFGSKYLDNPVDAVERFSKSIIKVFTETDKGKVVPVDLKRDTSRWERFNSATNRRILTGIPDLDSASGGISCEDEFMIISARLGMGKSWLGHYISMYMAKNGYKVGIYSGEMGADEVGARLDTLLTQTSNYSITRGKITDFTELQNAWEQVKGEVKLITTKELKRNAKPSDIRKFVKDNELDVVILDQISLMEADDRRGREEYQDIAQLSLQLKTLQQELRIPIIAISQLNRLADKDSATAANLSGSDRLGQDATLVLGLERSSAGVLKIKVLKARSFRLPDSAWEYDWNIDGGTLTAHTKTIDTLKVKIEQSRKNLKDKEKNAIIEDEEII